MAASLCWGVASMLVRDALSSHYKKSRDYERHVRQVRRDLDNLEIALAHIKENAGNNKDGPLSHGPAAEFVKRAQRQLRDGYRALKRDYPKNPSISKRIEYATHPGAEMQLLDIGTEANQTARSLNDLLSEVRFASMRSKPGDKKDEKVDEKEADRDVQRFAEKQMGLGWENDVTGSPLSSSSPYSRSPMSGSPMSSVFSNSPVRPSSITSPPSSARGSSSSRSSGGSTSRSRHRSMRSSSVSQRDSSRYLLPPQEEQLPLGGIIRSGRDKDQYLDNLQDDIELVMRSSGDKKRENVAMESLENSIQDVLRVQRDKGFTASHYDQDVGDAVEELDFALQKVLDVTTDEDDKECMQHVAIALEDVEIALQKRQRHRRRSESRPLEHARVQNLSRSSGRNRRYSVY